MPKKSDKQLQPTKSSADPKTARGQRHQYKNISPVKFNLYVNLLYDIYVKMWKNGTQLADSHDKMNQSSFTEFKKQLSAAIGEEKLNRSGPLGLYWHTENTSDPNPLFSLYEMHHSNHLFDYLYILTLLTLWNTDTSFYQQRTKKPNCYDCPLLNVCTYSNENSSEICLLDDLFPDPEKPNHPYFSKNFILRYLYLFCIEDLKDISNQPEIKDFISETGARNLYIDSKTINARFNYLCKCGYLEKLNEKTRNPFFRLRRNYLSDIIHRICPSEDSNYDSFYYRFLTMLDFFSETLPLGEIGNRLISSLDMKDYPTKKAFRFKHRFILNTLNDFKLIDILYAIQKECFLKVTFTDNSNLSPLIPLQIRISGTDGRENLIYFHPDRHEIQSFCLDRVKDVSILPNANSFDTDLSVNQELCKAKMILKNTWGLDFDDIAGGNCSIEAAYPFQVHAKLSFPAKTQRKPQAKGDAIAYIKERIIREADGLPFTEENLLDEDSIIFDCEVTSFDEFKSWLRQYIQFTDSISITPGNALLEFDSDTNLRSLSSFEKGGKAGIRPSTDLLYTEISNSIFSFAWRCFGLRKVDSTEELKNEISTFSTEQEYSTYVEPVLNLYHFVRTCFPSNSPLQLPLNKIEINYLYDIARSPFVAYFLEPEEIKHFQDATQDLLLLFSESTDLKDDYTLPIFDLNKDIIFCHLQNGRPIDPKLASNVRRILDLIYSQKTCNIRYLNRKTPIDSNSGEVFFDSLFYSSRENTVRAYVYRFSEDNDKSRNGRTLRVDNIEFSDTEERKFKDPSCEQICECKRVVDHMIFNQSEEPGSQNEVKIGLIGMKPSEMERFLHEISYYTVENEKRREYSNSENIAKLLKLCAVDMDRTGENASFEILCKKSNSVPETYRLDPDQPINFEKSSLKALRRVFFNMRKNNDSYSASDNKTVSINAEDISHIGISKSLRFYLPCVISSEYQDLFEYVVTIHYPGNDFSEIADILHKYKDIFVLLDDKSSEYLNSEGKIKHVYKDSKDITNGTINRTHSVPLKILLNHESIDLTQPVSDSFAE